MRFKAKLSTSQIELLHNLITPISKLSGGGSHGNSSGSSSGENLANSIYRNGGGSGSVIYLDPEYVRISAKAKSGGDSDGIFLFAEVSAKDNSDDGTGSSIFLDHRIESVADDIIVFEIDLTQLKMALQSILENGGRMKASSQRSNYVAPLHNSTTDDNDDTNHGSRNAATSVRNPSTTFLGSIIVLKLAKRNGLPCLCLDSSTPGGLVDLHHAIPVRIMRPDEMQYHLPPQISMPDVQLELPSDRLLKTVIERLRAISPQIYIEGSMTGELILRIDGEGASIRTFYSNLVPRFEDCKTSRDHDPPAKTIVKVDSKKLNACLQWQATMFVGNSASSAILCLVENEMLVLHVSLNPGTIGFFTYYVPIHYLPPEDVA